MNNNVSVKRYGILCRTAIAIFAVSYALMAFAVHEGDLENLILAISKSTKRLVKFEEKKYSEAFSEPVKISGELEYEPGKHFIKRVIKPFRRSYEIRNETLVLRKGEKIVRQISINEYPSMRGMFEALRSTFAGDVNTLRNYYHIRLNREKSIWTMTFTPKHSSIVRFIDAIIISGSEDRVNRITTRETGGDYSEMTIKYSDE